MKRKPKSSPSKKFENCFYCLGAATGKDHVPGKVIFRKPYPQSVNFTTLPCCSKCNEIFAKDEEYLIGVLAKIFNGKNDVKSHLERVLNRSERLKGRLNKSVKVLRDGQIYFAPSVIKRLSSLAVKYTIGMYWRRYARKLHRSGVVGVLVFHHSRVSDEIMSVINTARFGIDKWNVLQRGVFSFVFVKGPAPQGHLWAVFKFYNTLIVKTTCPAPGRIFARKHGQAISDEQLRLSI